MNESMKNWVVYYAKQALQKHEISTAKTEVRDKLQDKYGGKWNCVMVTCQIYYWVWHWYGHYIYFKLGNVDILVFETHS